MYVSIETGSNILTREDTATDGDISGEGAFLVNVSAVNSLEKQKFKRTILFLLPNHYFINNASALPIGSVVRALQAWKTIVRKTITCSLST